MEPKKISNSFRLVVIFSLLTIVVYLVSLTVFVALLARDHWALQTYATSLEKRVESIERAVSHQRATSRSSSSLTTESPDASDVVERLTNEVAAQASGEDLGRSKRDKLQKCKGCKAKRRRGRKGDKGDSGSQGPKGDQGIQGPTGDKGDQGPPGPEGKHGDPGPQGSRGPKGDPAPKDNSSVIAESAHLVGDGSRKLHAGVITYWKKKHTKGSLHYNEHKGELIIGRTGYYYVYSQMYYYDGSTVLLNHYTLKNGEKILGSASSVVSPKKKYNTNGHGGVFLLRRGDKLSVAVYISKIFLMKPEYTYFGTFMVHPE